MQQHLARSIPYIKILQKTHDRNKIRLLKTMPKYVLNDIVEVLVNILEGNCECPRRFKPALNKVEKKLTDLVDQKTNSGREAVMYKQRGGGVFLGLLLPAISALVSGLLAR